MVSRLRQRIPQGNWHPYRHSTSSVKDGLLRVLLLGNYTCNVKQKEHSNILWIHLHFLKRYISTPIPVVFFLVFDRTQDLTISILSTSTR